MKKTLLLTLFISVATIGCIYAGGSGIAKPLNESLLLRFPDIHGENIVFTYAGDLYISGNNGGGSQKANLAYWL